MPDLIAAFEAGRELEALPTDVAAVIGSLPEANAKLLLLSAERLWSSPTSLPDTLLLRNIAFAWDFYLVKQGKKTKLFFKRQEWVNLVLRVQLRFKVVPHSPADNRPALNLQNLSYVWVIPRFIVPFASETQFQACAPANSTRQDTILLAVGATGEDVFALAHLDRSLDKVKMKFTPREGIAFVPHPDGKRWPAAPFLALFASIRSWIAGAGASEQEADLRLVFDQDEDEVQRLLRLVTQTYVEGTNRLNAPSIRFQHEVHRRLIVAYHLNAYEADLQLRLNEQGELADDDNDDPFKLQLQVRIQQEKAKTAVRIRLGPPDFLVSGTLYQHLLEKVAAEVETNKDLRQALQKDLLQMYEVPLESLTALLRTGAPQSSIFRIQRKKEEDTDVFALPFAFEGQPNYLIFKARFKIPNPDDPATIELKSDRLELLYDPRTKTLDEDAVKYFVRIIKYLKQWFDHLK